MINSTDNNLLKLLICTASPFVVILTSFFIYYSINTIYNIFVPRGWIEQDIESLVYSRKNLSTDFLNYCFNNFTKSNGKFKNKDSPYSLNSSTQVNTFYSLESGNFDIPVKIKNKNFNLRPCFSYSSENSPTDNSIELFFTNPITDESPRKKLLKHESFQSDSIKSNLSKSNSDSSVEFDIESGEGKTYHCTKSDIILTIQIPVYNESFNDLLSKTLINLLKTCRDFNDNFDKQINILICEDGLQAINPAVNEKEINDRIEFYNKYYEISYIARQKQGRRGKFKKASNINFSLNIINKMKNENLESLSKKYNFLYKMENTLKVEENILLGDRDSQMDIGAIQYLLYEIMTANKKTCYLQCRTVANLVCLNNWEKTIGHFTNAIYDISFLYSAANGNPAPLVGHNCILNWKLITKVLNKTDNNTKYYNNENELIFNDGYIEYWNENGVSEDFSLSLDLYIKGFYGKYVYFDCGFKEGVTLNVDDEIVKFSKYAFGVNEIIFNPINKWSSDGILTPRIINFILTKQIPFYIKISILSYIGIYYSMAICPIVTLINFYLFKLLTDHYFIENILYNILVTVIIFFILTPISNIIVKLRHNEYESIYKMLIKEMYYDFMLFIFFGGMQYHFLKAIIYHFCDFRMSWGATNKNLINNTIVDKLIMYGDMYLLSFIVLSTSVMSIYFDETFLNIYSLIPLSASIFLHVIMPIVL